MFILAEKSSVAKDFVKALNVTKYRDGYYYNDDTVITYCVGHLFEPLDPENYDEKFKTWKLEDLPIIPEPFRYRISPKAASQARIVVSLLKKHSDDEILIATDADREGELIARITLDQAGIKDHSRIKRFWVSEALTPEVVRKGIQEAKPLHEYDNLSKQGYARQKADWLVGFNFTRFMTVGNHTTFSVGRVQTAVLYEIAKRNHEIKNFKPEPYYELEAKIQDVAGFEISAFLLNQKNENRAFLPDSNNYLTEAYNYCKGKPVEHTDLSVIKKTNKPEKLLNINALQKEAYKRFGYSPEKTLSIAQSLYETHKCLSYPRTASRVMGDDNVELIKAKFELLRPYYKISDACNPELISADNKHVFNSAQLEAHHALIPLIKEPENLTDSEKNIFNIVVESFFKVFMNDFIYNEKTIIFSVGQFKFKATFRQVIEPGWKTIFSNSEQEKDENEQEISDFNEKECSIKSLEILKKMTKPKKEYSIDTLLTFMEKPKGESDEKLAGLGTPATRAEIIKKLFSTEYIVESGKKLKATDKGMWLLKQLSKDPELSKIANVNQTTFWENELNNNPEQFYEMIKNYVTVAIRNKNLNEKYTKTSAGPCPICGKPIIESKKLFYCQAHENEKCNFILFKDTMGTTMDYEDVKAILNGNPTKIKTCRKKDGSTFKAKIKLGNDKKLEFEFVNKTSKTGGKQWKKNR